MDEDAGGAECGTSSSTLFPIVSVNIEGGKPLFPASAGSLFAISQGKQAEAATPAWLANTSFSESLLPARPAVEPEIQAKKANTLPPESGDEDSEPERETKKGKKRKKDKEVRHRKKHKKREAEELAEDTLIGALKGTKSQRKATSGIWLDDSSWQKDYYFDTRGDRDILAFESLYRFDIARYHLHQSREVLDAGRFWKRKVDLLNPEGDSCAQEESLRSGGRYWSSKMAAIERRRDFKRLHIISDRLKRLQQDLLCESFISLEVNENEIENGAEKPKEENWEDYVLNKTREFNQKTHDEPQNERLWMAFAKFQDELIQAEKRKTMMQHAIDKKILLLEKALEYHPDSEELVLLYLETCRRRDDLSSLHLKWERMLMKHSGSYRLWWEYLRLRRTTFSKFSVSAIRKLYSQALQALVAARNRKHKDNERLHDSGLVESEMGIITIFLDLCRFEWQTGHHELAIGLFQAQFEYNYLCPLIQLSQSNKLRLFEAFWNSGASRIGESGALGWNTWMEQEEEQIQKAKTMTGGKPDDDSTWSGWKQSQALNPRMQVDKREADAGTVDDAEDEDEQTEIEDDAVLLEKLGLNLDLTKDVEIKDSHIWKRWSEEEIQRDCAQWFPLKPTSAKPRAASDDNDASEEDEGLEKMVLFDDIRENLLTLLTEEARFHLLGQFLEFCNAPLFQWCCSNTRGYKERFDSLEGVTTDILMAGTDEQNLGSLLFPVDWMKESNGRATFLRNTIMLLRDVFSHNLHFQEVILSLEALDSCDKDERGDGSSASRALAKQLLKVNRQDLTLWAAYACFEASTGNVEVARRVFDTALTSLSALPKEAQSDAPAVYLAYAEVEMAQSSTTSLDFQRVLYILHFLGVGEPYQSKFSSLSGTQVLKARRGYHDQLQKLYKLGGLNERGTSLIICAALFQQLTAGWQAATSVFEESLAMFRLGGHNNVHLERLLHCYIAMLESQKNWVNPTHMRRIIKEGIQEYPFNLKLLTSYKQCSLASGTRRLIDELSHRSPSSVLWLFALSCELASSGVSFRIHNLFERALEAGGCHHSALLWRLYIAYELKLNNPEGARRVFFRAIHACPWSKALWMDGFQKMSSILSVKELSDLVDIMRDKELRIRTDVYEILLEEVP